MSAAQTLPKEADQRRAVRRQPAIGTIFRLEDDAGVGLVWNLSTSGISMLYNVHKDAGEVMRGELVTSGNRISLPVILKVAHACKVRTGDFFVGAQFEHALTHEQIHPFLGERVFPS